MKKIILILTLVILTQISYSQWVQTSGQIGSAVNSFAINGSNIFIGTNQYGVYLSTNNGGNWTLTSLNRNVISLAVNGSNVFAGTLLDSGAYRSTNNGVTWSRTSLNTQRVNSLTISGSNIYAGTDQGLYFSTDNGTTWIQTSMNYRVILSFAINGSNMFVGTVSNGIYRSTNNGITWTNTLLNFQTTNSIVINSSTMFAGTTVGLYYSTDNGWNWTPTPIFYNQTVNEIIKNGSNIFAGTSGNGVYLSTDNGGTWTQKNEGLSSYLYIFCLGTSTDYIFAGTSTQMSNYMIWKRPLSDFTPPIPPTLISPLNNSTYNSLTPIMDWSNVSGAVNYRIQINDGDSSFTSPVLDSTTTLDSLIVPSGRLQLWHWYYWHVRAQNAGGNSSYTVVWKFQTGLVGINKNGDEIPNKFTLYQNYPNPFNPTTNIRYDLQKTEDVKIKVFDILGKEVTTLVNEKQSPGKYEVNWDGRNYPSGVYFYKLNTEQFTDTKGMILIK